ncbi:hypothetical protein EVAR_17660_1 [Eumeta japonica]|uniref:Uncharacterized protein n=1 Tax=Eumeta variegata TaxID=151549 RepID=A0A4C1URL4_EUMVA|nr:hypothetical protein EVAR_17660_1 [Eumeta japonica]
MNERDRITEILLQSVMLGPPHREQGCKTSFLVHAREGKPETNPDKFARATFRPPPPAGSPVSIDNASSRRAPRDTSMHVTFRRLHTAPRVSGGACPSAPAHPRHLSAARSHGHGTRYRR